VVFVIAGKARVAIDLVCQCVKFAHETVRKLGIGFVAYSPLGRGFLTAKITNLDDLADDDWRRSMPRFEQENFRRNMELVERIKALAARKGCSTAQLAIAWVLAQGDDIVPIPGTKRRRYLEENIGALDVQLSPKELAEIDTILPAGAAAGSRYSAPGMRDHQQVNSCGSLAEGEDTRERHYETDGDRGNRQRGKVHIRAATDLEQPIQILRLELTRH
jgi:Aldo/keto reductase family